MAKRAESAMARAIRLLEFIGKLDDGFSRPLIAKYSHKVDAPFQSLKELENSNRDNQSLKLMRNRCIFEEGNDLNIEIYKRHSRRWKILTLGQVEEDELTCTASIDFDDLWKHLVSESQRSASANFKVDFTKSIPGLQLWIVAEAYDSDLLSMDAKIKSTMENLNDFRPILSRLGSASDGVGMFIEFGKAVGGLNAIVKTVFSCIDVAYQHIKAQEESHKSLKSLAESIAMLASQLDRVKKIPNSEELYHIISEFPGMMGEVMDFIQEWLEHWTLQYTLVAAQKGKAIELREKLDVFAKSFDRALLIEIRLEQAIIGDYVANLHENAKAVTEQKKLDGLLRALGGNRLSLHDSCMEGTRLDILKQIETGIKSTDGNNVIWIKGCPGVGKSALAASIAIRLEDQGRHVISFRFDRKQSTITTDDLWRVVASDLARLYPGLRQHLVEGSKEQRSSDIDRVFKSLIEGPLSKLNGVTREELPVIVIDGLDECGGLRHDPSGRKDYDGLLRTLRRWVEIDHLKKFKLVITSRPESRITKTFPDSISTYINIPSGGDVKPEDSASDDIRTFLKSRLSTLEVEPAWIAKALDYLVPRAVGVFIWATTVAEFLQDSPQIRFDILEKRKRGDDSEGFDDLHSLYLTVITTSFGRALKPEIKAITSVIGATIFAKQPLNNTVLVKLPGVKSPHMLDYIRNGLISVIDSDSIFRFHHRSFEDFLLSPSFREDVPKLSDIQDRDLHERQLALLCLNTMVSSELHFNMCNLKSSSIKNVDILVTDKSAISPLISYSSQFWADHLVQTQREETLTKAVEFVMYNKLLFWIEVMSILEKAHEAYTILKKALEWPALATLDPKNELTSFIRDALRFISVFLVPISQGAPQIYISALPFAPKCSLVGEKFRPRFPNTLAITDGRPSQWPMTIFTAEHHKDPVWCIALSPDETTFASISKTSYNSATMYVCDSETGHCISGPFELRNLELSDWGRRLHACFSPDGKHILVGYRSETISFHLAVVWDIGRREEVFRVEGFDFVFIHSGRNKGGIASVHWIDEGGFVIRTTSQDQHLTRVLVRLWDFGNGTFDKLFEVTGVAVARFSPNGQYLAVGRQSENVVELWNLEDGKSTHQFPHLPGNLSSLHFSPTSDCLMAAFRESNHKCLWRLDTQRTMYFDLYVGLYPPAVTHSLDTNHIFVTQGDTVKTWRFSKIRSNKIFETEPLTSWRITSICPSRDGQQLLVGSLNGNVRMRNLEDFESNQPVAQNDTNVAEIIAFSPSGKMMATKSKSRQSTYLELRDTTTWELVGPKDVEYESKIAFSADDSQIAVLSKSLITIHSIMHPENHLSFDPWPKRRCDYIWNIAFQTCNDLVICSELHDSDEISSFLQVWKLKDHTECTFSLNINIQEDSSILLAPDGLTVIFIRPISCYSWNHNTAQFHRVNFTDEAYLDGNYHVYSPDGKLFACCSRKDNNVRVWDTRTGQLCGKSITMSWVNLIAFSPVLNDQSPGERLISLRCYFTNTISLFDVHNGQLRARFWSPESDMAFIQDGTKLASYHPSGTIRIHDIVDLAAKHRNATHGHEPIPQDMRDGWMVDQDKMLLFWVPLEHRQVLCLPHAEMRGEQPMKVDFSSFMYGSRWTECIDQGWSKELEEKEKEMTRLLD